MGILLGIGSGCSRSMVRSISRWRSIAGLLAGFVGLSVMSVTIVTVMLV